MELKNQAKNLEKWTQALTLLFEACRPLTFDCENTKEEIQARDETIFNHILYCEHVKGAIEDGVEPLSWDVWSDKATRFSVQATARPLHLTKEEVQQLANDLTRMF
jgi:hypothetical protein